MNENFENLRVLNPIKQLEEVQKVVSYGMQNDEKALGSWNS